MRRRIGHAVRTLRNLNELTQTELARRVGVAPSYVCQIEANQRTPSLPVLGRIAEELGVTVAVLLESRVVRGSRDDAILGALRVLRFLVKPGSRSDDT